MPKPVYIICAENITQDKETNLVTISNVIETLGLNLQTKQKPEGSDSAARQPVPVFEFPKHKLKSIAVWQTESGDAGKFFETGWAIYAPGLPTKLSDITVVRFDKTNRLNRMILNTEVPLTNSTGILKIENRIRRKGDKSWKNQSYRIEYNVAVDDQRPQKSKAAHRRRRG